MIKRNFKYLLLLFFLLVPATKFLFTPGQYWNMHDDMQLVRQLEMEKCLFDGQIPCRWVPDLGYGYGYPLFNYYPPLPYFIGQGFRLLGFSFVGTIKAVAVLQFFLSALGMFILGASLFGPVGGLISSVFFTYAPYHAVNIYIRGAMNEAWAGVFFPFIFYSSRRLIQHPNSKNFLGLALSLSGLMLSHNPMLLIFSPFIAGWCLFWIFQEKLTKTSSYLSLFKNLFFSGLLALGLSAFFTLPVIFENNLVQINSMFTNYYSYAIHFVSLKQLFLSNFWGDGPSLWGPKDGLSFSVGLLHWLIPLFILGLLLFKKIRHQKFQQLDRAILLLITLALFSLFMAHERSTPVWKLFSTIQKIQFPWRFLNISAFLTSLTIGYLSAVKLPSKPFWFITGGLLFGVIIINLPYFTPVTHGPVTDSQKFSGIAWRNQITGGIYDYLPTTASTAPKSPAPDFIDQVIPNTTKYSLFGQQKGTDWQFFNLTLNQPATVYLSQLAFPQFKVTINGQTSIPQIEPELGRISLNLNAGTNQIYLKLFNTPIRQIANFITIISAIIIVLLPKLWKK